MHARRAPQQPAPMFRPPPTSPPYLMCASTSAPASCHRYRFHCPQPASSADLGIGTSAVWHSREATSDQAAKVPLRFRIRGQRHRRRHRRGHLPCHRRCARRTGWCESSSFCRRNSSSRPLLLLPVRVLPRRRRRRRKTHSSKKTARTRRACGRGGTFCSAALWPARTAPAQRSSERTMEQPPHPSPPPPPLPFFSSRTLATMALVRTLAHALARTRARQ